MTTATPADPRDVLTRPAPPPDLVLSYGPLPEHVVDLRLPAGATGVPAPLVLMIHGGFWRSEYDRTHTGPLCADLAARGYATASIEFRRIGKTGGGWPTTFDDIALATDRVPGLVAAAAPERVDPDRLVLMGHSAGGHLALWAAARHRLPAVPAARTWQRDTPLNLRGVVALAPVAVLDSASRDRLGDGATDELLGGSPAHVPERYALADPVRLLPSDARTVLVHGELDDRVPIDNARGYLARAQSAGDDVSLHALRGIEHFAVIDPKSRAWPVVLNAISSILSED